KSGVPIVVDPLGGSYFVETMTSEIEQRVLTIFDEIDALGGVVAAVEQGYFQRRIADSAYRYEQALADQRKIVVGINAWRNDEPADIPVLHMDPQGEGRHLERLRRTRAERDPITWSAAMVELDRAARCIENVM